MTQRGYYFVGFFVAMFAYMAVAAIGKKLEIPEIDLIAQLLICVCLVLLFPESESGLGWGRRSLIVVASCSVGLFAIWTLGFWIWESHSSSFERDWRVIFPLIGVVVITPWFEEKLVRHLLLHSIDGVFGPIVASVLVSLVFAYAHKGMMLWAFIISIVLCGMRFRFKAKTAHCVIVHGLINAYVILLYML